MLRWFCLFLLIALLSLQGFSQDSTRARNRFALGLAYTSGPRAYGSKGFFGPQATYTFGKGRWEASAFVGGYYSYNEDGSHPVVFTSPGFLGGQALAFIVFERKQAFQASVGIFRHLNVSPKLIVSIGAYINEYRIQKRRNFKTLPTQEYNPDSGKYINRYFYDHVVFSQKHITSLTPAIKIKYSFDKQWSIGMGAGVGPSYEIEDYSNHGSVYIIKGNYNPFIGNRYEPYNTEQNNIQLNNRYTVGNRFPLRKNFDLLGNYFFIFQANFNL